MVYDGRLNEGHHAQQIFGRGQRNPLFPHVDQTHWVFYESPRGKQASLAGQVFHACTRTVAALLH